MEKKLFLEPEIEIISIKSKIDTLTTSQFGDEKDFENSAELDWNW